jgi:hypothetical protein
MWPINRAFNNAAYLANLAWVDTFTISSEGRMIMPMDVLGGYHPHHPVDCHGPASTLPHDCIHILFFPGWSQSLILFAMLRMRRTMGGMHLLKGGFDADDILC